MKIIVKGKAIDASALVVYNDKNEIMITESQDGSFSILKRENDEEIVSDYIKPDETDTKRKVTVMVKNVQGDRFSDSLLWELGRSGIKTGRIIQGMYNPTNKSVDFIAHNGDNCTLWVDSTCEVLQTVPKHELAIGMVFFSDSHPDKHVVIIKISKENVLLDHVDHEQGRPDRFSMGYNWFNSYYYVRTMSEDEFKNYAL